MINLIPDIFSLTPHTGRQILAVETQGIDAVLTQITASMRNAPANACQTSIYESVSNPAEREGYGER